MANPTGEFKVKAGGKEYRLHLGMSVLADLQAEWGDEFEAVMTSASTSKLPNLKVVQAIFMGALQRYHSDVADRWLVDDIIAENQAALPKLLNNAFPDDDVNQEAKSGGGKKKAAV